MRSLLLTLGVLALWAGPVLAQDANGDGVDDVNETNLVPDGDMEAETAWARYGTACVKSAEAALQGAQGLRCGPGGAGARVNEVAVAPETLYRVRWRHRLTSGLLYVFVGTTTDGVFTALPNAAMTFTADGGDAVWGERYVRTEAEVGDGLSVVFLATDAADLDAVSVVTADATGSLIANGTFERAGPAGWQPYSNTACALGDDGGEPVLSCPAFGTLEQSGIPVQADTIYTLRYRVRVNTSVVQTYLGFGSNNFSVLPGGFARHRADGQWQVHEQRVSIAEAPNSPLRFIIYAFGDAEIDDVTLVPSTGGLDNLIVDGGFENGSGAWGSPRLVTPCSPSADAALEGGNGLRCTQGTQSLQTVGVVGGEAYVLNFSYRADSPVPSSPLGELPASPDWRSQTAIYDVDGDAASLTVSFTGAPTVDVDSVQLFRLPDALRNGEFRSLDGWRRYTSSGCTLDPGVGYGSDESMRCAPGGMAQRGFALTPGQNYRLRFAWQNGASSYLWAFVGVRTNGTFAALPGGVRRFNENTEGAWRIEEIYFTAPDPGAGVFDVTFLGDDAHLDAVSIVPVL